MGIEELRKNRLFGIALFDVITSYIFALVIIIIFWKFNHEFRPKRYLVFNLFARALVIFLIGYLVHFMLNIKTKINN